ncbi:squalene/phytoene synthase family protein [Streptomyces cinnabarinus]|uniref:Squalene/phytoene synthase family protein n=1 Tax=Streptomyces cinnabarinus TaxID=67287 RepID=A0ABY7K4C0_9ACTN|nr:squalene/phytoene synthase family protein [Streptomyces cinnabarinus]WAZ19194.1 squalene/phytoene synthase family protein [Streptomyces cinnabarinus]
MPTWTRTLRQAGIAEPDLQAAYGQQRRCVRKFKIEEYATVRLLLPAHLHPAVIATVAFMHETDQRVDTGATHTRREALAQWATATQEALHGTPATDTTLKALGDAAVRNPQLRQRVEAFLDGARHEVEYAGFETEDELQSYVDGYSLPAFMLLACLIEPVDDEFEHRCRDLIEAMQRVDFLEDLAEDAAQGHVGIPAKELERHGLSVASLNSPTDEVRSSLTSLVHEQSELARLRLTASRPLVTLVPLPTRPFITALLQVQELRLRAVHRKGGGLADGGVRPAVPALLGVLARQYRAARRQR